MTTRLLGVGSDVADAGRRHLVLKSTSDGAFVMGARRRALELISPYAAADAGRGTKKVWA